MRAHVFVYMILLTLGLLPQGSFADTTTTRTVVDSGYEFDFQGYKIKWTESDGIAKELPYNDPNITTPCSGKNLPANRTRDARVEPTLSCSGGKKIDQVRAEESFEQYPEFVGALDSGDVYGLFEIMRDKSQASWTYRVPYTTNVNWTWTKHLEGQNGEHCGYTFEATSCEERIRIDTETCVFKPDPPSSNDSYSPGGGDSYPGGGGFSPGGGGGGSPDGGGSIEDRNPFVFLKKAYDIVVPKAYAGRECTTDTSYTTRSFTCHKRYVKSCQWAERKRESMTCTAETLMADVEFVKTPEDKWNPSLPEYVPFLPNGYDLLPGEKERAQLDIRIAGHSVNYSNPKVVGGLLGEAPSYYTYDHAVTQSRFSCTEGAQNTLSWKITSLGRQTSQTPNSLTLPILERQKTETEEGIQTGFINGDGDLAFQWNDGELQMNSIPLLLRIFDHSAGRLNTIASKMRNLESEVNLVKDTFYRIRIREVFPGRDKFVDVTLATLPTESLVYRRDTLIAIPMMGQFSTNSAYDQSASGYVLPENFFRSLGWNYQFIPDQHYEIKLSMLHRGIPFYHSGCADGAIHCEREAPNEDFFSEELTIPFVYQGPDERSFLTKYYDALRRWSWW